MRNTVIGALGGMGIVYVWNYTSIEATSDRITVVQNRLAELNPLLPTGSLGPLPEVAPPNFNSDTMEAYQGFASTY